MHPSPNWRGAPVASISHSGPSTGSTFILLRSAGGKSASISNAFLWKIASRNPIRVATSSGIKPRRLPRVPPTRLGQSACPRPRAGARRRVRARGRRRGYASTPRPCRPPRTWPRSSPPWLLACGASSPARGWTTKGPPTRWPTPRRRWQGVLASVAAGRP
jgi:hypothetical protein